MNDFDHILVLQHVDGCFIQITFFLELRRAHIAGRPEVYDFNFLDNGDLLLSEECPTLVFEKEGHLIGMPRELKAIRFNSGDKMVIELLEEMVERELLGKG